VSITSLDGIVAGAQPCVAWAKTVTATLVAGRPTSLFTLAGNPGPGTPNTGLTGANYVSSSAVPAGILYHADPGSGNSYLARFLAQSTQAGTLLLCDRLWDCGPAVNSTAAQTISQPTLPARDSNGTTNGLGVQLAIETVAATSSSAAVISVSYTNSAGTASRTGAFIDLPTAAVNAIGNFYRIGLQAGDQGARSVQSVTFSTDWTSGTIALVAYRVLAALELSAPFIPNAINALTAGFPQLYNGVCPFLVFLPTTTTASNLSGSYTETQG
jgi:hypothetical protein